MTEALLSLARLSVTSPREGMRALLNMNLDRRVLWPAMWLVVALSSVLYNVAMYVAPPSAGTTPLLPTSPFLLAALTGGVLVLSVFALHYLGRMFGGVGGFSGSLLAVVWTQVLMLMAQVVQIGLLFLSPGLGNLFGLGVGVMAIWLFVNFVAELHAFRSLGLVFAGIVGASIGVVFGLSILLAIVAVILGIDPQNV